MRIIILFVISLFVSVKSYSQETVANKIALNKIVNPTTNLFVHFDKNIYSNNETIYFTAYILKTGKFDLNAHKILAVTLTRDVDSALIKVDRFLIRGGLAFGNMIIPDSMITGNYHLLAYTDKLVNGKPELIFKQKITIKTNIELPFRANIKLVEKPNITNQENKVLISVTTNDYQFLAKPVAVNYKYGNLQKTAKTDASGQLLLTLPKLESLVDPNIHVKLKSQKDSSFLSMPLPSDKIKVNVKFFPESGNLVNNLPSTVSWEVTDLQKRPIALKAFLLKNNSPIDTIETNSYGMGNFKILTEENAIYTVKLVNDKLIDSTYTLPKPLTNGLVINIENAVTEDTLRLSLKNTGNHKIFIRVHNFKDCFLETPFDMEGNARKLKIPLTNIPKGLHTITITDSLNRPLAERLFFAHYDNKAVLSVETDKPIYQQREKVTLKLTPKEIPKNTFVSIAVVQENRISLKNNNDIENYFYVKTELENVLPNSKGLIYKDRDYLEQILSVKGWRKYTWQQTLDIKPSDTIKTMDSLLITGVVKKNKKPPIVPINLAVKVDSLFVTFDTSAKGDFNLNIPELITEYGKKVYLFVNDEKKERFDIQIDDPFGQMSKNLSKTETSSIQLEPLIIANNADLVLKNNERAIQLREVTIKNANDKSFYYSRGANACGDYVCLNSILNCSNHFNDPQNRQPVAGITYKGSESPYLECTKTNITSKYFVEVAGIRYHKEFYLNDYKDPLEPAFFSTIYWNYGTTIDPKKETELSFYTSDITGKFKVVIQGVTGDDVVYTENKFEVKQKGQIN